MENKIKIPDQLPGELYIPTLNQMGFMTLAIDPYSLEFIDYAAECSLPVLDIGVAYGLTTLAALEKGAHVFANDLDIRHLEILKERTPIKLRNKLEICCAHFPKQLTFENEKFGAILATRVLHFLTGDELEQAISLAVKWLVPGGKLFVVSCSPYVKLLVEKGFLSIYRERREENVFWPGEIHNAKDYHSPCKRQYVSDFLHVADIDVLARTFLKNNLVIEKVGYISYPDYPEDSRHDGREGVGIIGRKL